MKKAGIALAIVLIAGALGFGQATSTKDLTALAAAAQKEGQLTVIALPHDWVNYGEMIQTFSDKYGITVNELNPDGSSGEEVEAIRANKGNMGPQAPDVIDVGLSFGPSAKADGLLAPYKVQTWASIPNAIKDKDGYWYGDYYGALAFEVNSDIVKNPPKDWADLLKPEYKGKVALAGDPRLSAQAYMTVLAASLSQGGSVKDIGPGLKFFDKLNKAGNFVPIIAVPGTVASGRPPSRCAGTTTPWPTATRARATPTSRSSSRRPAWWRGSTCRPSAPTPRTRTPRACGWSTCTPTRARSSG